MRRSIGASAQFSYPKNLGGAGIVLVASAACTFPAPTYAADEWNTPDKRAHLVGSTAVGVVTSGIAETGRGAFAACAAVGAGKELLSWAADRHNRPSAKDMTANLLGCGIGVAGGRFLASKSGGRVQVTYSWEY